MINEFNYALSLANTLYNVEGKIEDLEEIGLIGWNLIGNKMCKLLDYKIIAIARGIDEAHIIPTIQALIDGGIKAVELPLSHSSKESYKETLNIIKKAHDTFGDKIDIHGIYLYFLNDKIFDNENEEGFWGINNFSQIWEDMCNTFFIDNLEWL